MSAIDLSYIDKIKSNVDTISGALLTVLKENKELFKKVIIKARQECPRFCMAAYYTDLYFLYKKLYEEIENYDGTISVQPLLDALAEGKELIKKAVVANAFGEFNKHVHGISIYFPFAHIDKSYPKTLFAQESMWLQFLQETLS